ncbi:SMI1/KNR4 family protein [Streptomyces hokutonensis]|uniref:SMI1/KNR4 family protein n=1 Tax=Streptomyces hokutonensis TaxID=1306990 RepID=UPI0037F68D69
MTSPSEASDEPTPSTDLPNGPIMWLQWIEELQESVQYAPPATSEDLDQAARTLGRPLPDDLVFLLQETNGLSNQGVDIVWSIQRIVRDNIAFRSDTTLLQQFMSFDPLLFFGDNGDDDAFAFVQLPQRLDVFFWNRATDGRSWAANSLRSYVEQALTDSGNWYYDPPGRPVR